MREIEACMHLRLTCHCSNRDGIEIGKLPFSYMQP